MRLKSRPGEVRKHLETLCQKERKTQNFQTKPNETNRQTNKKNTSRVIYLVYNIIWYFFKFIYHLKLLLFLFKLFHSIFYFIYFGNSNLLLSLTSFFTLLTLLYTPPCFFKIHALFFISFYCRYWFYIHT